MIKPRKIGHIVLNVSNLDASLDFYCKALGLEVVSEHAPGKIAFLSLGEQHHDLALVQGADGARVDPKHTGLVHMAWQLGDFPELQAAYAELNEVGIESEPIQHNVTNSLYMRDPDGNLVELYCDRWGEKGKQVMQENGPQRRALDMATGEAFGEKQELLKPKV